MNEISRCQSCGMPLGEGFHGLTEDGFFSQEYCKFCYHEGQFIDGELELSEMISCSVEYMVSEFHFPKEKA